MSKYLICCICTVLLITASNVRADNQISVLAIHSYHQEYLWTQSQYEAFKHKLQNNLPEYKVNFSSEYLDTKRIEPSEKYKKNLLQFIHSKYDQNLPDLIYVTDDNALNFVHSNTSKILWKNVPVIFSGVNNTRVSDQHIMHPFQGVFEIKDIKATIDLAKSITKKTAKIMFVGDGGTTDKVIKKTVNSGNYSRDGYDISHQSFSNLDQLINRISQNKENTIILSTIGRITDNENNLINLKTSIKAITNSGLKILVMEDTYLFPGVIGGYVTSATNQGKLAANIASNIIRKNNIPLEKTQNSIELVLSSPSINKFKLNKNNIPEFDKARIINKPLPLMLRHPELLQWLILLAITLASILIVFIYYSIQKNAQLKKQYTDPLTGLKSRIKLLNDIKKTQHPCLMIIDINNFKSINNLYGLKKADIFLKSFAEKLREKVNDSYKVYRVAGDKFAILSDRNKTAINTDNFIQELLNNIQQNKYKIGDIELNLTLTAGISKNEHEFLIPRAEQALEKAKKENKSYCLLDKNTENLKQQEENILWAQKLNSALTSDRIVPYYQVITHNITKEQNKHEALVRLIDEKGDAVSPFFFLDTAKSTRQYSTLTKVMIEKTFKAVENKDISVSINMTVEDIRDSYTITFFKEKIKEYGVGKKVIVELTESEGIENYSEVANFIKEIKELGCRVAIDDFGTGYSNFTHLIHLNVDYLKIDGSIIKNILIDKNAEIVAKTLVDFAQQLGIETIAEFVDSEEILNKVTEIGIDYSQGFLLGKPQSTLQA